MRPLCPLCPHPAEPGVEGHPARPGRATGGRRQPGPPANPPTTSPAQATLSGMMVTDSMGAVTRTVLETLRTLFVWLLVSSLACAAPPPPFHGLLAPVSNIQL